MGHTKTQFLAKTDSNMDVLFYRTSIRKEMRRVDKRKPYFKAKEQKAYS